jgi:hypothetical protein
MQYASLGQRALSVADFATDTKDEGKKNVMKIEKLTRQLKTVA